MPTTRSTLARKLVGAAAVPALAFAFAACGDDDDSAGGGGFCDTARNLEDQFEDVDFTDSDALAEVTDAVQGIDPPAEIADDWETMVSVYETLADVDMTDPEALAELQDDPQFENAEQAVSNVESYLEDECGLDEE